MWFLSVAALLALSLFGYRALFLFCASNGMFDHLERATSKDATPNGRPMRPVTSKSFPTMIDQQLRAVATFHLIFCENLEHLDALIVGFSFGSAWGTAWMLIMLESLRSYSKDRFMSWYEFLFHAIHALDYKC
jgi:hypothetical protein